MFNRAPEKFWFPPPHALFPLIREIFFPPNILDGSGHTFEKKSRGLNRDPPPPLPPLTLPSHSLPRRARKRSQEHDPFRRRDRLISPPPPPPLARVHHGHLPGPRPLLRRRVSLPPPRPMLLPSCYRGFRSVVLVGGNPFSALSKFFLGGFYVHAPFPYIRSP